MNIKRVALAVFAVGAWDVLASAAVPNVLTYQGTLQEAGSPVTGTRSVEVVLCAASTGANCVASVEGPQNVAVSIGVFRSTFTAPGGVDLTMGPWFLEVRVAGTALSPREQLTSSPYAVAAGSAASVAAAGIAPGTVGAGVNFSGSVGIGTTSPAAPLAINGNAYLTNWSLGFNRNPNDGSLPPGGSPTAGRYQMTPLSDRLEIQTYNSTGTGTGAMVLQAATGNVGIGTTSPGDPLSVVGSGFESISAKNTTASGGSNWPTANVGLFGVTTNAAALSYVAGVMGKSNSTGSNTAGVVGISQNGSAWGALGYNDGTNPQWGIYTGSNTYVGGNVGIGNAAPAAKLHLSSGTLLIDGNSGGSLHEFAYPSGQFTTYANAAHSNIGASSSGDLHLAAAAGQIIYLNWDYANSDVRIGYNPSMIIKGSGNVGISTTSPAGLFQVGGGTLTVTSGGNVGIGTTAPTSILQVNGPIAQSTLSIAANYAMTGNEAVIFVDATAGPVTVTLPAAGSAAIGRRYEICKVDSTTNVVAVAPAVGNTAIGSLSVPVQGGLLYVIGQTATQWIVRAL